MGVMSDLIRRGSPVDALQSASNAVAGMALANALREQEKEKK